MPPCHLGGRSFIQPAVVQVNLPVLPSSLSSLIFRATIVTRFFISLMTGNSRILVSSGVVRLTGNSVDVDSVQSASHTAPLCNTLKCHSDSCRSGRNNQSVYFPGRSRFQILIIARLCFPVSRTELRFRTLTNPSSLILRVPLTRP